MLKLMTTVVGMVQANVRQKLSTAQQLLAVMTANFSTSFFDDW